jgi:hypothetical protein
MLWVPRAVHLTHFLKHPDALWWQKKPRILPSLWLNNFNWAFMQVWIFACHAKCLGLNAIDCQKTDFRLVLKWWEAENLHSRGTLKTWGKGNSPGAGCSWNKRSTKAEPRGTYFGNALLQGYTFPEGLAAFFFIFFPLHQAGITGKKEKEVRHFEKWNGHWAFWKAESPLEWVFQFF